MSDGGREDGHRRMNNLDCYLPGLTMSDQHALRQRCEMVTKTYIKSRNVWKVKFELPKAEWPVGVNVRSVHVTGDFNRWDKSEYTLKLRKGVYSLIMELQAGEYQYRYVINGTDWYNDWHADGYVPNNSGSDNCVLQLQES